MKGILFTADNHKAIREGRKTVTRRVIKPQPPDDARLINACGIYSFEIDGEFEPLPKPRYQVGEVVYIKEAWAGNRGQGWIYKSDYDLLPWSEDDKQRRTPIKWRSPLFMPAWAARDFLQITDVRAERLQEISYFDIKKEGWQPEMGLAPRSGGEIIIEGGLRPQDWYENLWDSINGEGDYALNKWAWRYEFKRVAKPVSPLV